MITSGQFGDINQVRGYWQAFNKEYDDSSAGDIGWVNKVALKESLNQATARYTAFHGVGRMQVASETQTVTQDVLIEGYDSSKTPTVFSNGLIIGRLARDNAQDPWNVLKDHARMFVTGKNDTISYQCASALNSAHTTTAPDGQYIFSATHPIEDASGTWSNMTSAQLSYSSLKDMLTSFQFVPNGRGAYKTQKPGVLLVPTAEKYNAMNILGADAPGTTDRDMNVLKAEGLEIVTSPYLSSSKICFLFTKDKNPMSYPLRWIEHTPFEYDVTEDKDYVGGALKLSAYMVMAFHVAYLRGLHSLYSV